MGSPNKIWAISAVHSETEKLEKIHAALLSMIKPGDKILYLGNYSGYKNGAIDSINEILMFRRQALCIPGVMPKDFVYLKGAQEEMMHKLFQIQFAPNPTDVFLWMLGHGLAQTLEDYQICPHDGIEACRKGVVGLAKWTNHVREKIRQHSGHEIFANQFSRAAHTDTNTNTTPILFVHAGIDFNKSLEEQGDRLWWGHKHFKNFEAPYAPFHKVIRGFDPSHNGLHLNCVTATLDGGSGFGGTLIAAGFAQDGEIAKLIEA